MARATRTKRTTRILGSMVLVAATWSSTVGCTATTDDAAQTEGALGLAPVTSAEVDAAKRSGDATRMAKVLHALASDRIPLPSGRAADRVSRVKQLFDGATPEQARAVRAAYITTYREDPEITIRSDGLGAPIARLDRADELAMVGALDGPQMAADATLLADMLDRAGQRRLTQDDRKRYFATLSRMGLWDAPVRVSKGDDHLDALERTLLSRAFAAKGKGDLDAALRTVEAALPAPDLAAPADRSKSIAVVASSHGAQWQELMGWATVMAARGYHLQVFTPEGRPVAFQRDSLSVSVATVPLGFGCPADLDPAGPAGDLATDLLSRAAPAAAFDASRYGAVYLAGGLGFNEDVAHAEGSARGTVLTANPNVAKMMQAAIADKLPLVAICHGPTLFAATPVPAPGGGTESINKGIETASLPPFEAYVGFTGRKEIQFTYDVNTHDVLAKAGGITHVAYDVANMSRVVKARKLDIDVITGPGPQAASNLAEPTIEAVARRWGR